MIFFILPILILITLLFYKNPLPQLSKTRKLFLISLRFISLAIIFILLLNPILRFRQKKLIKPKMIILNDISASMDIKNGELTKHDIFRKFEHYYQDKYKKKYELISYDFASDLEGEKHSTNLSKTLKSLFNKYKYSEINEIILLSDCWFDDDSYEILSKLNIPINCVVPEMTLDDIDLSIIEIEKNETAFLDEINPINIKVNSRNYTGKALVKLSYQDKSEQKTVDFSKQNIQNISFDLKLNKVGLQLISAEISSENLVEHNVQNNKAETAIMVNENQKKILIIADNLNWDVKFFISALAADNKFSTNLLIKKGTLKEKNEIVDLSEKISDIDVLVIFNNKNLYFQNHELQLFENYFSRGGSLIFIGDYQKQFSQFLPSKPSRIRSNFSSTFMLSESAKNYASFDFKTDKIPPLTYKYLSANPEAKKLAFFQNDEHSPAILFSDITRKTLQICGHDLWRWQMFDKNSAYNDFVVNIANWLASKTNDSFISYSDKSSYSEGETIRIELIAYDERLNFISDLNAKITLFRDDKLVAEQYLINRSDKHFIKFENLPKGNYKYNIIDDKTAKKSSGEFVILQGNLESNDLGLNITNSSYICQLTNGKLINDENYKKIEFTDKPTEKKLNFQIPIYKNAWLIILFITTFCLEIYFRKRWGLL